MGTYVIGEGAGSFSLCVDSGVMGGFQAQLVVALIATDGKAGEYYW